MTFTDLSVIVAVMYSTAGEKILAAATRLFYTEGIHAIGVDRVVAESGASKPTLYAQFGTKDGLVAAVLQRRSEERKAGILADLEKAEGSKLLALFDRQVRMHERPEYRGCPFTLASAELTDPDHPARVAIADYKTWIRALLRKLAEAEGLSDDQIATLGFLIDGSTVRIMTNGDHAAMAQARGIVKHMLEQK